ncbi:MAG: glycogen synthase [Kiritimatiellae bacterium]|nr:glycogen synthase [Kiritimatiellia bacterium]MCO5067614.1 glycogen synthase [Kiritimatiellia bacterium]
MKLAYISSEITPYASTGGLAEVAASLPMVLKAAGHEVVRFMPCYRRVLEGPRPLEALDIKISVPVGMRTFTADIMRIEEGGVPTYFIRRDEFFDRSQLYNLPERDYEDNFERFVFFQKAVIALIDRLELNPDIIHCNDWQTGLMPYFLEYGVQGRRRGRKERVVFTLHNVAYQGLFPDSDFALTNLPFSAFSVDTFEYYGKIGCLKAGITGADAVTTVSPTYAREILTEEGGFGLDGVLRGVQDRLVGILNGIDTEVWDPAIDPDIAANYDAHNLAGKMLCRDRLAARMNLQLGKNTLILAMVSRLVDLKGIDLLSDIIYDLLKRDIALVILGSGQQKYENLARQWAEQWPGRVGVRLEYNAPLAHEIQAGADMLLLPSKSEPCGLTQFCGQRYGTLPVVHAVGGLRDSVLDPAESSTPTGIKFFDYSASEFLSAIDRGVQLLQSPPIRKEVARGMMSTDVSWRKAATQYEQLYERLLPTV